MHTSGYNVVVVAFYSLLITARNVYLESYHFSSNICYVMHLETLINHVLYSLRYYGARVCFDNLCRINLDDASIFCILSQLYLTVI